MTLKNPLSVQKQSTSQKYFLTPVITQTSINNLKNTVHLTFLNIKQTVKSLFKYKKSFDVFLIPTVVSTIGARPTVTVETARNSVLSHSFTNKSYTSMCE